MEGDNDKVLNWKNIIYLADFLDRTNEKRISLLGGEPTLHPEFTEFVLYLINRGFHVTTFTSGVMSSKTLNKLTKEIAPLEGEKVSFVCNVNNPDITPEGELKNQLRFLEKMGHQTNPGFNIYREDFDLTFIFDYIEKYNLRRHVRLGLAHPIYGKANTYIKPDRLGNMAKRLVEFFPLFEKHNVSPGFDCGMPLCIFENEELGQLLKISKNTGSIRFSCGPAIDIGPNMDVWSCFPLSDYEKKSIFDFDDMQQVAQYFNTMLSQIRTDKGGVYEQCQDCEHRKNNTCTGGCIVHGLNSGLSLDTEAK